VCVRVCVCVRVRVRVRVRALACVRARARARACWSVRARAPPSSLTRVHQYGPEPVAALRLQCVHPLPPPPPPPPLSIHIHVARRRPPERVHRHGADALIGADMAPMHSLMSPIRRRCHQGECVGAASMPACRPSRSREGSRLSKTGLEELRYWLRAERSFQVKLEGPGTDPARVSAIFHSSRN
jgi:hypothetical protein